MAPDDPSRQLAELRSGNSAVIASLFGIIHRQLNDGEYTAALQTLYLFATSTSRGSENEKAVVVQSIAVAAQLAYKHELYHAAKALDIGARYSADLPERQEVINLATNLVDLALAVGEYHGARQSVAVINICARLGTKLHQQAVAMAIKINAHEGRSKNL